MLTELQEEQASLYALDLLEGAEVTGFQREMLAKPELQLLVEDLRICRDVVVTASAPLVPPADLKKKILEEVAKSSPAAQAGTTAAAPVKQATGKIALSRLILPWSLAACLTLLAAFFSHNQKEMQQELTSLQGRFSQQESILAGLRTEIAKKTQAIAQLESRNLFQASTIAQLRATSPQANPWTLSTVSVVWDKKKQEGILVLAQMPAAEVGKIYQLWVIDPSASGPVSAGTFEVQADGTARVQFRPSKQVQQAAQFAVSLEQGGEKQQPEGPVILAGASL